MDVLVDCVGREGSKRNGKIQQSSRLRGIPVVEKSCCGLQIFCSNVAAPGATKVMKRVAEKVGV